MSSQTIYDYVIIGAGPAGITLAYSLSYAGKKCLLIDKNSTIGGCHRVTRSIEGLFTEHGPRIYSNSYVNTIRLLRHMNINFYDYFTPYLFAISNLQGESISHLNIKELSLFALEFIKLLIGISSSKRVSVKTFVDTNNFTDEAKDYLNRICRLTDGAGYDRYSLYNFLQLINQQTFYKLYQPKKPNDVGLFQAMYNSLIRNGVDIWLNSEVLELNNNTNNISDIVVNYQGTITNVTSNRYIFCIPPKPYNTIISKNLNIKNSYTEFDTFSVNNTYINDIPVVFHWDTKLELPKIWGFPKTEWGLAFIVLSDYMNFDDDRSKTVISTCLTIQDVKSSVLGKIPDECSRDELINEMFRQLKLSYPDLPQPTFSILHPTVQRINNKWVETDTAYVSTYHDQYLTPQNTVFNNLYFVGTQNGNSHYNFTSFESAVSNALYISHSLESKSKSIPLRKSSTLIGFIRTLLILLILIILYFKLR